MRPTPTEWERACHRAAEHMGAFSWTHRVAKLLEAQHKSLLSSHACYKWNSERGYRQECCAGEMARACERLTPTERTLVGWAGCHRNGPEGTHHNLSVAGLGAVRRNSRDADGDE